MVQDFYYTSILEPLVLFLKIILSYLHVLLRDIVTKLLLLNYIHLLGSLTTTLGLIIASLGIDPAL